MFPFGGSTAAFPIRPTYEQDLAQIFRWWKGDWDELKPAAWEVPGPLESGVFDRPDEVIHPVFSGPGVDPQQPEILVEDDSPEFLPGWPEEWKSGGGGWVDSDWVYPDVPLYPGDVPRTLGDPTVAVDWGAIISGAVDIAQGQRPGGGMYDVLYDVARGDFAPTGGITGPPQTKMTFDPATGKITRCRRRRRRRLLTPTDLNDLAALKTIVGGGQAINFAVMKAVRR